MVKHRQNIDCSGSDKGEVIMEREKTSPDSICIPKKLLQRFKISFFVWLICLGLQFCLQIALAQTDFFSPAQERLWPVFFLGLAYFIALIILLVFIGKVSHRLNKSLVIWVGISIIVPLFSIYAYIHLSRRAKPLAR